MGLCLFATLYLFLQYYATNSQPQEQFYFFDFNGLQGWTIENVGSNLIINSTSSKCQNPPCWQMEGQSVANFTISTIGYHTLRIIIDVTETGLHNGEYCYFEYKSPSATWQMTQTVGKNDNTNNNVEIIPPDNINYNNQQTLYLRIGNAGNSNVDKCFYDNLEIWGIPYTTNPTTNPTHIPTISPTYPTSFPSQSPIHNPTNSPIKTPTKSPTNNPTPSPTNNPTPSPTNIPTISPTPSPTNIPSSNPTLSPTYNPSLAPTNNPTYPTKMPSNNPSNDPTYDPTNDPTSDPSIDPTSDPTADPTFDPTIYPTNYPTKDPTINPTPSPILRIPKVPSLAPTFKPTVLPIYLDIVTTNSGQHMEHKHNDTKSNIGILAIIIGILAIALCIICIGIVLYKRKNRYKTNEKMAELSMNDLKQNNVGNVTHSPVIQMTSGLNNVDDITGFDLYQKQKNEYNGMNNVDEIDNIENENSDSDDDDIINAAHITLGGFDLLSDMNVNQKQNYNGMNNSDDIDDIENNNQYNNEHEGANELDEDVLPMVNNMNITPGGNEYLNNGNENMITCGGMDIDVNEDSDNVNNNKMKPKITIGSDQPITIGGDFDVDAIDPKSSNDGDVIDSDYGETIQ